jgi:hypothetical protein
MSFKSKARFLDFTSIAVVVVAIGLQAVVALTL